MLFAAAERAVVVAAAGLRAAFREFVVRDDFAVAARGRSTAFLPPAFFVVEDAAPVRPSFLADGFAFDTLVAFAAVGFLDAGFFAAVLFTRPLAGAVAVLAVRVLVVEADFGFGFAFAVLFGFFAATDLPAAFPPVLAEAAEPVFEAECLLPLLFAGEAGLFREAAGVPARVVVRVRFFSFSVFSATRFCRLLGFQPVRRGAITTVMRANSRHTPRGR